MSTAAAAVPATNAPQASQPPSPAQPASGSDPGKSGNPPATAPPAGDDFETKMQKERERIAATRAAKAKQKQIEQRLALAEQILSKWNEIKTDPAKILAEAGYDHDKYTEWQMARGTPDAKFKSVETQMAELRAEHQREIQKLRQELSAKEQKNTEDTVNNWKASINTFLSEHPEDYELTLKFKSEGLVAETAEEFFKAHGKVLSNKEAADLVEEYWLEQVTEATKAKKIQAKLGQKAEDTKKTAGSGATQATVTNDMTGHANVGGLSPATERERMSRALAALG